MRRLDNTIWIPHTTWCSKPTQNQKSQHHATKREAGSPKGQGPESSEAQKSNAPHRKQHLKPSKAVTTNSIYPSPHGSQMKGRAPSLLSGALGQQGLKLSHLLVEHVVQHCLLVTHLLAKLLLHCVLKPLHRCGLCSNGVFKV